jgi:ATP-dependent Clp protease ATP-binding subunit ClpC
LTDEDLEKIVDLLIGLANEVMKEKKISVLLKPDARKWLVSKTCRDRSYGARPLRRAIQKYIEDPLSESIIQNRVKPGSTLEVFLKDDSLHYTRVGQTEDSGVKLVV